jgi:hypothetical protein
VLGCKWNVASDFKLQLTFALSCYSIQEVVLERSVTIYCGRHSVSWAQLSSFSHFLATSSWTLLLKKSARHDEQGNIIILGHNTPARLAAAQKTWLSGDDNKFLYSLIRTRSSVSENIRDKVYSQLGLGDADLFPSYMTSVAEVYTTAAEYILEHSESLLLLTYVEGEEFQQVPGLPSWVPDWSVNKTLGLRMTGYHDFNAALDLPKQSRLSRSDDGTRVLTLKATALDEIVNTCQTKKEICDNLHTSDLWAMISILDPMYAAAPVPGQSREEAVWRALATNRETRNTNSGAVTTIYPASSETLGPSFRSWVLWRYAIMPDTHKNSIFPKPSLSSTLLPSEDEIKEARAKCKTDENYLADLERQATPFDLQYSHAMLLRPFITKQGYFGVGTQCLRKKDTIWVVPGCPIPLIFRPIEVRARYRLVGGTYVHGFMNGEILKRQDLDFEMVSLE